LPNGQQKKGPGFWDVARVTTRSSRRWGLANIRNLIGSTSNWVQPVFDIDRPRYDDFGGSQFAVAAGTPGLINQFPSCIFVDRNDWELHEVNAFYTGSSGAGTPITNDRVFNMFTPDILPAFYDPVANGLTGPFGPQVVLTYDLHQGDMLGFGGTNAAVYPGGLGLEMTRNHIRDSLFGGRTQADAATRAYQPVNPALPERVMGWDKKMVGRKFSPALRVPAERVLAFQVQGLLTSFDAYAVQLEVSILYNELETFG